MSEGVDETAVSFVVPSTATTATTTTNTTIALETTLECSEESKTPPKPPPPPPPPLTSTKTTTKISVRKHRKHATTSRTFHLIDGKKIRSALTHKKWPPRDRRVSFPTNDNELVTGYLEPANPWEHAENVNIEGLISSYKASCQRHGAQPLENLVAQLEKLDISDDERCPELSLKNECLDQYHCEPLEELLKRVQFEKIDVESSSLDDESATILFDMLEYYQSARHLNMSSNRNIGSRGWQACAQMIKKTTCLEQLEARDITLTQQHMNILKRPLQLVSHLRVLKLENCGLAGRAFVILVSALKMNTGLKELYLADNGFEQEDAIQLGALLRVNNHLQLLDISNNHIKDEGVRDLLDGLVAQSGECRNGKGLSILVLWNNDLTRSSSTYFSEAIAQSVTLETLNIGKNPVGNELLELAQEALIKSQTLLQLGMQSTSLNCKGALLLAGIIERNRSLERIDLRDNNIQMEGLAALSFAVKRNPCVTQLDLDPTPWSTKPATMDQYRDLVAEIRTNCARNEERTSTDSSTEESGSPQHRSRLSSVSSRKISLTCQTLPRSPPSIAPSSMNEIATRSMLEPKRTTGGRLRSPAPSPIPSPVASPIPSPSRGRFVVSRVCENSLSSTNSSASSSPVTPSSLGSSPTCFFPASSTSVSSRFRVTVVETKDTSESSKPTATQANTNVTIGFNYKIEKPENSVDSDDSDSVFRSDVEDESIGAKRENESIPSMEISIEEELKTAIEEKSKETKNESSEIERLTVKEDEEIVRNKVPVKIEDNNESFEAVDDESQKEEKEKSIFVAESTTSVLPEIETNIQSIPKQSAKISSPSLESVNTKVNMEKISNKESLRDEIIACYQSESKKPEPVQRQASSLERLLGLFQHPGSLFSSGSYVERTETKNPIQDGVNSMIALGDKFQQYLRDGRNSSKNTAEDSTNHPTLQRSVSDASRSSVKSDPVKSLSIPQLSSIQAVCSGDFGSREEASKHKDDTRDNLLKKDSRISRKIVEESPVENHERNDEERVSRISDDLTLPENTRTEEKKNEIGSIDDEKFSSPERGEDSLAENVDNSSANDCRTSVCSKLMDIPEYSILETKDASLGTFVTDETLLRNNDNSGKKDNAIINCDSSSSTTDSINDPSFKNSSHFNVKCDIISGSTNVHTLGSMGDVHNFFTRQFHRDNETVTKDDDDQTMFVDERSCDIENLTSRTVDETESRDKNNISNISDNFRGTIDDRNIRSNLNEKDSALKNVDRLSESSDNCSDDNERFSVSRLEGNSMNEEHRQTDTIEEFFPLERNSTSSLLSQQFTNDSTNDSSRNNLSDVASTNKLESNDIETSNSRMILQPETTSTTNNISRIFEEPKEERISELFVRVPNSAILKNEFSITRIAIASIDDDDYVPPSIEQVSSSLSEDSGYSGKLSVDEPRNGELSLNDSAEITSGNDTVMLETLSIDNRLESRMKETPRNDEERVTFVCPNVDSNLTSFLHVQSSESRNDSSDITSNESNEDLIFKITDIDGTTISKETTKAIVTKIQICQEDSSSVIDCYHETGQSTSGSLFIEASRNVHRNSQDSGIEETATSISEENCTETSNQQCENFQESLDSGIDSECSSVCARNDVGADVSKERARDPGKIHNSRPIANEGISRFTTTSRVDIDEILGNKDAMMFDDSSNIARIDDEINVAMKISDVLGYGRLDE